MKTYILITIAICIELNSTQLFAATVYVDSREREWIHLISTSEFSYYDMAALDDGAGFFTGFVAFGLFDFTGWTWENTIDVIGVFFENMGSVDDIVSPVTQEAFGPWRIHSNDEFGYSRTYTGFIRYSNKHQYRSASMPNLPTQIKANLAALTVLDKIKLLLCSCFRLLVQGAECGGTNLP